MERNKKLLLLAQQKYAKGMMLFCKVMSGFKYCSAYSRLLVNYIEIYFPLCLILHVFSQNKINFAFVFMVS